MVGELADLATSAWSASIFSAASPPGTLTAVTEDHLDRGPFFVYSTVWGNGDPWVVLTDQGERAPGFRTLSTKAAIGWHALYRTDYTESLVDAVASLPTPEG